MREARRHSSQASMADNLADQLALFNQYDSEYCSKATDVARKVQAATSLAAGKCPAFGQWVTYFDPPTAWVVQCDEAIKCVDVQTTEGGN